MAKSEPLDVHAEPCPFVEGRYFGSTAELEADLQAKAAVAQARIDRDNGTTGGLFTA